MQTHPWFYIETVTLGVRRGCMGTHARSMTQFAKNNPSAYVVGANSPLLLYRDGNTRRTSWVHVHPRYIYDEVVLTLVRTDVESSPERERGGVGN